MSRFLFLKQLVLALAVTAIVSLAAATAKADIVVVTGVNNQGTDNVLPFTRFVHDTCHIAPARRR